MSCADLCCQDMVKGQAYTFRFRYNFLTGTGIDPEQVSSYAAKDSNFGSPTASVAMAPTLFKGGVLAVSFIYQGQGSTVGQAGQEMQNVINKFWTTGITASLIYEGATTGVDVTCPGCAGGAIPGMPSWVLWLIGGVGVLLLLGYLAPDVFALEKLKKSFAK